MSNVSSISSHTDDWTTAIELTPEINYTVSDTLSPNDPVDYWKVFVNFTQVITAEIWLLSWVDPTVFGYYDFDLFIYDQNLKELNYSIGDSAHEVVSAVATASAWYYIKVERLYGAGAYLLTAEITDGDKMDDYWWGATSINASAYSGHLDPSAADPVDWFSIMLNATEILWVNLTFSSVQLDLVSRIYDEEQHLLAGSSGIGGVEVVNAVAYAPGLYYLEVVAIQGAGEYTLRVEITSGGEPDNWWWATPTRIQAGNYSGHLDPGASDPSDWFVFQLRTAEVVKIDLAFLGTQIDIDARVYDQHLRILDESAGYEGIEEVSTVASTLGRYYLELVSIWGAGNYSFVLEITPSISIFPGTYLGELNARRGPVKTWFSFQLGPNKTGKVYVEFPSEQTNVDCHLYDAGLQWIDGSYGDNSSIEEVSVLSFAPSTWYLLVEARWGVGNYSLTFEVIDIKMIDPGTYAGFLNESHTEDWFGVELQPGDFLTASILPNGTDFDVELFSSTGSWLDGSYLGPDQPDKVLGVASTSGIYGLRIFRIGESGSYRLRVTAAHAELITLRAYSGFLNASTPETLYGIELQQGDLIMARITTPISVNVNLELIDPDVAWSTGSFKPRGHPDEVSSVAQVSGTYFLLISRESGSGQYFLNINIQSGFPSSIDFAGDSPRNARKIIAGKYSDVLDEFTDCHDYYAIWLEAGDILSVTVSGFSSSFSSSPPVDFDLEVLAPDLSLVQGSWDVTPSETIEVMAKLDGTYYIHVYSMQGSGPYEVVARVKSGISPILDFGSNEPTTARLVRPGVYSDYLSTKYDPDDYYRIKLTAEDNVTLHISGWDVTMADFELQVLNSTLNILTTTSGIDPEEYVTFIAPTSGIFYIRVFSTVGSGWYELYIGTEETDSSETVSTSPETSITTGEMSSLGFQIAGLVSILAVILSLGRKKR